MLSGPRLRSESRSRSRLGRSPGDIEEDGRGSERRSRDERVMLVLEGANDVPRLEVVANMVFPAVWCLSVARSAGFEPAISPIGAERLVLWATTAASCSRASRTGVRLGRAARL